MIFISVSLDNYILPLKLAELHFLTFTPRQISIASLEYTNITLVKI